MSEISQEMLKKETEKAFQKSMEAFAELSNDENFTNIMKKYNTTFLSLASSMITHMFSASEIGLKQSKEIFEAVDQFIDKISTMTGLHPTDCLLLLSKIVTDMLMQVSTLIELKEKEN